MKLEIKEYGLIVEGGEVRLDGRKRPRIKEKILCKKARPSLVYEEQDILDLVDFLSRDLEAEQAKKGLLEFIAELCRQYDTDEWRGDGRNTYQLLLQLDREIGARKNREKNISLQKAEKKQQKRNEEWAILLHDFKIWQGGNTTRTAYAFCNEIGEYNKYGLCRSKIMEYLSPQYDGGKLMIEEEATCPKFLSFLQEFDLLILKRFAAYVCFASLNLCLAKTFYQYLFVLRYGRKSQHGGDRKNYTLFQKGFSEFEYAKEAGKNDLKIYAFLGDGTVSGKDWGFRLS